MDTIARHAALHGVVRTCIAYGVAVVVYIVITLFTRRLLTWNLAMLYFVVTLDLLPRGFRRVRPRFTTPAARL